MAYDPGGDMQEATAVHREEKKTDLIQLNSHIVCQKCRDFNESPNLEKGDLVIIVSNTNPENAVNFCSESALYKLHLGNWYKIESEVNGDDTILISGFIFQRRGLRLQKLCSRCGEPIGEMIEFKGI